MVSAWASLCSATSSSACSTFCSSDKRRVSVLNRPPFGQGSTCHGWAEDTRGGGSLARSGLYRARTPWKTPAGRHETCPPAGVLQPAKGPSGVAQEGFDRLALAILRHVERTLLD